MTRNAVLPSTDAFEARGFGEEKSVGLRSMWFDLKNSHNGSRDVTLVVEGYEDTQFFRFLINAKCPADNRSIHERIRLFPANGGKAVASLLAFAESEGVARIFGVVDRDFLIEAGRFDDFYNLDFASPQRGLWILRAWELEYYLFPDLDALRDIVDSQYTGELLPSALPVLEVLREAVGIVSRASAYYVASRRKGQTNPRAKALHQQWKSKGSSIPRLDELEPALADLCSCVTVDEVDSEESLMRRGRPSTGTDFLDLCETFRLIDSKCLLDAFVKFIRPHVHGFANDPRLKKQIVKAAHLHEDLEKVLVTLTTALPAMTG